MKLLFLAIIFIVPIALVAYAILASLFKQKVVVDNERRKRFVIRNNLTGKLRLLGQGTHYLWPHEIVDTEVDLNLEPMETEEGGHKALTSDGIEILMHARFNEMTGREFDEENGQLEEGHKPDPDVIMLAVTATDFANRKEYVAGIFSAAVDKVVSEFSSDELLVTEEEVQRRESPISVPKAPLDYPMQPIEVNSRREMLVALAAYIQREVNYRLRNVGYNVTDVLWQDLRPADQKLQQALDLRKELRARKRAADELRDTDLSYREKLSIGTDQQGEVARAQATIKIADAITDGTSSFSEAVNNSGTAVAGIVAQLVAQLANRE